MRSPRETSGVRYFPPPGAAGPGGRGRAQPPTGAAADAADKEGATYDLS